MALTDAIKSAATAAARTAVKAFPNKCDLEKDEIVDGGPAGDSLSPAAVKASNVRCLRERLREAMEVVVGGKSYVVTDRIYLEKTAATLLITPEYRLKVHATTDRAQMIFHNPIVNQDEYDPFVTVMATLVQYGHA